MGRSLLLSEQCSKKIVFLVVFVVFLLCQLVNFADANGFWENSKNFIKTIEGKYVKKHTINFSGDPETSENVENTLELVRISSDQIYFDVNLLFYNGHACKLYGIAYKGSHKSFFHKSVTRRDEVCNLEIKIVTIQPFGITP